MNPEREDAVGRGRDWRDRTLALYSQRVRELESSFLAAQQRAEEAELGDEIAKAEQAYAEAERDDYKARVEELEELYRALKIERNAAAMPGTIAKARKALSTPQAKP